MAPKTETKQWKDGAATDLSCRILRATDGGMGLFTFGYAY